jgi:hypothetical protein
MAQIVFRQDSLHKWTGKLVANESILIDLRCPSRPVRWDDFVCVITENSKNGVCELDRKVHIGDRSKLKNPPADEESPTKPDLRTSSFGIRFGGILICLSVAAYSRAL